MAPFISHPHFSWKKKKELCLIQQKSSLEIIKMHKKGSSLLFQCTINHSQLSISIPMQSMGIWEWRCQSKCPFCSSVTLRVIALSVYFYVLFDNFLICHLWKNKKMKSPPCYTPSAFAPLQRRIGASLGGGRSPESPPARSPLAECHTAHWEDLCLCTLFCFV